MRLDHAAIGNGRLLALVSPTSSVDWLCLPRFDSPSLFGRLLDEERGGSFRIECADGEVRGTIGYVRNTNVSRVELRSGEDAWEVLDFAPRIPQGLTVHAPLTLVRLVRPIAGAPRLRVHFDPRPDYARADPCLTESGDAITIEGAGTPLVLRSNVPNAYVLERRPFVLTEPVWFVLGDGQGEEPWDLARVRTELDRTIAGWRTWAASLALPSFHPEAVLRSALVLKLHTSEDTGAVIAAATTSIPEAMGTPRTWDYRYCWLRDAAFVVEALRRLGHVWEGERFMRYLRDVTLDGPLQPVYGAHGERELHEIMLPHLAGFRGNGHVRIGNAAYVQRQHDLTGELILCLDVLLRDPRLVHEEPRAWLPLVERLVGEAMELADKPDMGIWEFRTFLRPYTFSRAMCWVAMSRGAALATMLGRPDLARAWQVRAARERRTVVRRAYNERLGFFTQALDGEFPDASNMLLPSIGLIRATDPRFLSTLDAYKERLVDGGLMLRYRNEDDFGETHSAFTLCSLWWSVALAQARRLDEAIEVFERVVSHANPCGLMSEDIDPATGDLLGNFPQAYTHVGLVHAAITIGSLLDARGGHRLAWSV